MRVQLNNVLQNHSSITKPFHLKRAKDVPVSSTA